MIKFLPPFAGDAATLTAQAGTTLAATLPLSNMQIYSNSRVARFTSTGTSIILGDFDSAAILSGLVFPHTLAAGASYRLELFDAAGQTGNAVYDSAVIDAMDELLLEDMIIGVDGFGDNVFTPWGGKQFTDLWFDPVAAVSFRLTINDPNNSKGYFDIGRLYLDLALSPAAGIDWGHALGWKEGTKQERTSGGSIVSDAEAQYREYNFKLSWIDDDERVQFMEFARRVGLRHDFFLSSYPDFGGAKERDHAMPAKFTELPQFNNRFLNNHTASYKIAEA